VRDSASRDRRSPVPKKHFVDDSKISDYY
jgi:hypothetical protein